MRLPSPRASRAVGLLVATALVVPAVSAPAVQAATAASWKVPPSAWVTLRGHGFGHGHGMSQYGAEGAARQGLTFRQIADFYYPGTTWGKVRGRVTVLLGADTTDDLEVLARPGLTIRDGAGEPVALPANGATRWSVRVTRTGANRVVFLTGRWHRWGDLTGEGEFSAGGEPVTLVTPSGTRAYRGRLRAVAPALGLAGPRHRQHAAAGELPQGRGPARDARAVEPRGGARPGGRGPHLRGVRTGPPAHLRHYQLCDTTSCQVYGGYAAEHPASNDAVAATRRLGLLSGGGPAFTQFASSSGGWTSAGSVPYLAAVQDPYDGWSGNPFHDWSLRVTDTAIERTWPKIGNLTRLAITARDGNGEWGGRVRSVTVIGDDGVVVVTGDGFRSALGLRSTWLTFQVARRS